MPQAVRAHQNPASRCRAHLEQCRGLRIRHAVIARGTIFHLECTQRSARPLVEPIALRDIKAVRCETLLKPQHGWEFLRETRTRDGHDVWIRPHDQPRQRELVPGKARARILFGQRLNITVSEYPVRSHAMAALDIPHQFDHLLDLLLRVLRITCVWIAAVAQVDDLDADRIRIEMRVTLPVAGSRMPCSPILLDEPINGRRLVIDEIVTADFFFRQPMHRACKVDFRVVQYNELYSAILANRVIVRVDFQRTGTPRHHRNDKPGREPPPTHRTVMIQPRPLTLICSAWCFG